MAQDPFVGFIEDAWARLVQLISGRAFWSLTSRANENRKVVRTMRNARKGF